MSPRNKNKSPSPRRSPGDAKSPMALARAAAAKVVGNGGDSTRSPPSSPSAAAGGGGGNGELSEGEAVLARHGGLKKWYPAKVGQLNGDGTYDLVYDDGDKENGVRRYRIRRKGDEAPEAYEEGEEVDVRHGGGKKLYPARIGGVNGDGTYDIEYEDGDKEQSVSIEMVVGQWKDAA